MRVHQMPDEVWDWVVKHHEEHGVSPTGDQIDQYWAEWIDLRKHPRKSLLKPGRKILIHGYVRPTGYGDVTAMVARALRRHEVETEIVPIGDTQELSVGPVLQVSEPYYQLNQNQPTIVYTMWESTRLHPEMVENLNGAYAVLVPSEWCALTFSASGVTVPIHVVPLGVDCEVFKPVNWFEGARCIFGTCANNTAREGISIVINTFLRAFAEQDDVRLILKCPPAVFPETRGDPRIQVNNEALSENQMVEFYQNLTVYVSGSSGEGFGLCPLQAMACGIPVIGVAAHGHAEYLNESNGFVVEHALSRVEATPGEKLYEGMWYKPQFASMTDCIRKAYEWRTVAAEKRLAARKTAEKLSLEKFSDCLCETLTALNWIAKPQLEPEFKRRPEKPPSREVKPIGSGPISTSGRKTPRLSLTVVGPEPIGCGVGQYGRQVSEALGCAYIDYTSDGPPVRSTLVQWHPYYFEQVAGVKESLHERIRSAGRVVFDIHHPDHLSDIDDPPRSAVYHCRAYRHVVEQVFERSVYFPLMAPRCVDAGNSLVKLDNKYIVGWHGLWIPHKRVDALIMGIKELRRLGLDVGLIGIGGIHNVNEETERRSLKYWDECNELVMTEELNNCVRLNNEMLEYSEIRATLSQCSAFCLPYFDLVPGQSSAAALCVSLQKPLVLSRMPLFEEFDGKALFVESVEWEYIADTLHRLLTDPSVYQTYSLGCKIAFAERQPEVAVRKYEQVLKG